MTNSIWQSIAETPWWVYATFIFFFYTAFLATKPRTISLKSLHVYPFFFILITMPIIFVYLPFTLINFIQWMGMIFTGILFGWMQFRFSKIKAFRNELKLQFPGSWFLIIVVILALFAKYYVSLHLQFDFNELTRPEYTHWIILSYGFLTGIFIGRLSYAWRCVKFGPFV